MVPDAEMILAIGRRSRREGACWGDMFITPEAPLERKTGILKVVA